MIPDARCYCPVSYGFLEYLPVLRGEFSFALPQLVQSEEQKSFSASMYYSRTLNSNSDLNIIPYLPCLFLHHYRM